MTSVIHNLWKKGLITPPKWLPQNVMYETQMGSEAYGVSSGGSDVDVYGFCVPLKTLVFPHLEGQIDGFGTQHKRFSQYQEHHVEWQGRSHDLSVYSIIRYFDLVMQNNPNMIDSLFTPTRCVLYTSAIGERVRSNRRMFLHKGCWHKFKGYAYSQLHKMDSKNPIGKRVETVEQYGWDVKFGYHTVRLMLEVEQILMECDLDLERGREQLKAIRRGEWTPERVREFFGDKERDLEKAYQESELPYKPDEEKIKELLLDCLRMHYGSLEGVIMVLGSEARALRQIREILDQGGW